MPWQSRSFKAMLALVLASIVFVSFNFTMTPTLVLADWPNWSGPVPGKLDSQASISLIDRLNQSKRVWQSEEVTPQAKSHAARSNQYSSGRWNGPRGQADLPSGGGASPIAYNGNVYLNYYVPSGESLAIKGARGSETATEADLQIAADDVLLCIDAATGKSKWKLVEPGVGISHQGMKSPGRSGESAAAANGRVFALGSSFLLYACDAERGKLLWKKPIQPWHDLAMSARQQAIKAERHASVPGVGKDSGHNPIAFGDHLVLPIHCNLHCYEAATGTLRWAHENIVGRAATPSLWRHDEKTFIIVGDDDGAIRCIDPSDGSVVWSHQVEASLRRSLVVVNDLLLTRNRVINVPNKRGGNKTVTADLLGCYRLTRSGPKVVWEHTRETNVVVHGYWGEFTADSQHVYAAVSPADAATHPETITMFDIQSGKPLASVKHRLGAFIGVVDGRVLAMDDGRHMSLQLQMLTTDPNDFRLTDGDKGWTPDFPPTSGYSVAVRPAYDKCRLYLRGADGIYCYDLKAE